MPLPVLGVAGAVPRAADGHVAMEAELALPVELPALSFTDDGRSVLGGRGMVGDDDAVPAEIRVHLVPSVLRPARPLVQLGGVLVRPAPACRAGHGRRRNSP